MAMDTVNRSIIITAAARFGADLAADGKALKQALHRQSGLDARRLSGLSLTAALCCLQLRQTAGPVGDCAVYAAAPFASPPLFDKMADNVLNCGTAMPLDFIANLHNAPAFYAAQVLGSRGASLLLAADNRPESWPQILYLAADSLSAEGRIAVGWCYEPPAGGGRSDSIWLLLEEAATAGQPGFSAACGCPAAVPDTGGYWQGVADWLHGLPIAVPRPSR
ncbi:hypothetical protein [Neisseria leonii]|uniref:hypothetical protein n=1 Tax=Neisseria leonii TaxID=2995413 RepID=UPI00237BC98C|nr:hypothetical protein [Neisseria sp. 3986]MDD9325715.1 hypothetical protein [Neisseria sp. 3986]